METQTTQPAPALLPPSMAPLDERLRHFALALYVEAHQAAQYYMTRRNGGMAVCREPRLTLMAARRILEIARCLELPEPQWNGSEWMVE